MDIQLPDMNGLEATKRIKSTDHLKSIPIVALSAYAMKHDIQAALDAGCASYVTKPFESKSLVETLKSQLEY
jgi:two-component system cell cycle response regulator DivK